MKSSSHTCQGVVVHCIDFRFRRQFAEFLHERFPQDDYDLLSVAGGVKDLTGEGDDACFLLNQLDVSHRLHHPSVIVLIQHEDCGAYGGTKNFEDPGKELEFQHRELQRAKALIRQHLPQQTVELHFMRLSGEIVPLPG